MTTKKIIAAIFFILLLLKINLLLTPVGRVYLTLGGSSSSSVLFRDWIYSFEKEYPDIKINYQPTGSTSGQTQLLLNLVHLSSSDIPASEEIQKKAQKQFSSFLHIPVGISPIAIVYNLESLTTIYLKPSTIASILLGVIQRWDDPDIMCLNPSIKKESLDYPIMVVSRSDASGSTGILTDFLSQTDVMWKNKIGKTVYSFWDPPRTIRTKGGSSVAVFIKKRAGSFGYLPLELAEKAGLSIAAVLNQSGNWVIPTKETCFFSILQRVDTLISTTDSIVNSKAPYGYPIIGFNWILVKEKFQSSMDAKKIEGVFRLVNWLISEKAVVIADRRGFLPLPIHKNLKMLTLKEVSKIQFYKDYCNPS